MSKLLSPQLKSWQPVLQTAQGLWRVLALPGVVCLLLTLSTLAAFWPVVGCGFINYDDPSYLWDNDHVLGGLTKSNIVWAFRSFEASNWHPLTWLSHMLDVELFGRAPTGPHCVNLALHVANTLLLFLLLRRMTGAHWRSTLVAALFALHPLHVESVAWVAERKDVLSTFFGLLCLWAYAAYVESTVHSPKSKVWYALALVCFALGLMSKPMLVTLPFVMLLLDYWPLQRFELATRHHRLSTNGRLLWEKTPFLLLSAASSVVTVLAQRTAMTPLAALSFPVRFANALVSYARYLGKTIWPVGLALPYPHPVTWPLVQVLMAGVLVSALCLGAVLAARRLPFLLTGWFWFFGMLVPVIGMVQVGIQSMADRYTYMSLNGLFIILAWGGAEVLTRWCVPRWAVGGVTAVGLLLCGLLARHQAGYWRDGERLFRHAAAVTKDNYVALNLIGACLAQEKRLNEAIECYRSALRMSPSYGDAQFNLGNALAACGQDTGAIASFEATLRVMPLYYEARNNLGNMLRKVGRSDEALAQYRMALQHAPEAARIHENLAGVLAEGGKLEEAITHYRQTLVQRPDNANTHYALGLALALQGKWDEAIGQYTETLRLAPGNAEAEYNLGYALRVQRRLDGAMTHLGAALRLKAGFPLAHYNLACVLADKGRRAEAVEHLREALRLKPDYTEAKQKLRELGVQGFD